MDRTNVKMTHEDRQWWRNLTNKLGWGERGMLKLFRLLMAHAEAHPDLFRKR